VEKQDPESGEGVGQEAMMGDQNANHGVGMQSNQNGGQMPGQFGYGGNQGAFSGMNWAQMNGFNPMMQMQMQNNVANGNWGFPNMMGKRITSATF
jgi:hypothetical protein